MPDKDKNTEPRKRINVIFLTKVVALISMIAAAVGVACAFAVPADQSMAVITLTIGGLFGAVGIIMALGKDIVQVDSEPFDAAEAAHAERMRQLELDHAYRNAQNDAMNRLIAALAPSK